MTADINLLIAEIIKEKLFGSKPQTEAGRVSFGKNIVILQRGWVVVGDLFKEGSQYYLENGSVVRVWGTEKGLGQLAMSGPLEDTKLDPIPVTQFHELTTVAIMKCSPNTWR